MVHAIRRENSRPLSAALRGCVLSALVASVFATAAHAATPTPAALADTTSLAVSMKTRDSVRLGLPASLKQSFPSLAQKPLACVNTANISPMVGSYAVAMHKALTSDEVGVARAYFDSVEGQAYVDKQLSVLTANPNVTPTVSSLGLTATETTKLNQFTATSAGQKLLQSKAYVTAELRSELASHLSWMVKSCGG